MDRTKQCKKRYKFFSLCHLLFMIGPFLYFIPMAYVCGSVGHKCFLSIGLIASLMLLLIALLKDVTHRRGLHKSAFWLSALGISTCLTSISSFMSIMAATSIIDELFLLPKKEKYLQLYRTNIEIDRRQ